MRYYIIINGVNSLTIPGLAIRQLPAISKPAIRTIKEEIDGRDGDITTELGYSAYDKTLEIGLFGNYDIDRIISFFNSKGTIVFSDENDKYYNFEITDEIDYDRLIKYRTASINIHCQPFKYPLTEEPIEKTMELVSGSGTTINLTNTVAAKFGKFDIKGNTSQSGTPTPSAPIPVNVVKGNNTITITGKNLFDKDNVDIIDGFVNGSTGLLAAPTNSQKSIVVRIPSDTTITISGVERTTSNFGLFDDKELTVGSSIATNYGNINNGVKTIATGINTKYIVFLLGGGSETYGYSDIQIEAGSSKTTYENYQGKSYTLNLGDLELCKIGTAQDYIYINNGAWYKHQEVKKKVLNGTEDWTTRGGGTSYAYVLADVFDESKAQGLCSHWYFYSKGATNSQTQECIASANTDLRLSIFTNNSALNTVDNLKAWLSNNNVTIYYNLATPEDIQIDDETLIAQLEEILNAYSYENNTEIIQTNADLPANLEVSTLKAGTNELVVTNAGTIYSKPIITIEGTGRVSVYVENEQKFEVNLADINKIEIDTNKMEAINPDTNILANRKVRGDYSKFKLEPGDNNVSFGGIPTKVTITNYTRWL